MSIDPKDEKQAELFKQVLESAIDSWLDKQFTKFGKWTFYGMAAAVFAWVCALYFSNHGFKP